MKEPSKEDEEKRIAHGKAYEQSLIDRQKEAEDNGFENYLDYSRYLIMKDKALKRGYII